jgi:DNA-directed RNA polymerase subunit RPC12/RpoP
MISHFFRCLSCGKQHGDNEAAALCCAFAQEVFRCDDCGREFANEGLAAQHVKRSPLTECEAAAIADGIDQGAIKQAGSWQGPAGCFAK